MRKSMSPPLKLSSLLSGCRLQNAVIISAPDSPFIDRWLASYESFDEGIWAHHSVVVPWVCLSLPRTSCFCSSVPSLQEIARTHPAEIQVLSSRAFFWPMWHGEEIQYTHENDDYDFRATGQYACVPPCLTKTRS